MFRVLIVDDNFTSRSQIKAIFSQYGDCDCAPDGEIAFKLFVAAHQEKIPYDIITMDIDMPDVKGDQVVQKIRQWEKSSQIYQNEHGKEATIVMISALSMKDNILSSFNKGCEAYIVKPITGAKVKEVVDNINMQRI